MIFKTFDTPLACSLVCSGFCISSIEKTTSGENKIRFLFSFDESDELNKKIKMYWDNELYINAKTLLTEFHSLKQRLSNLR